jgi:hypothetical protein
MEMVEGWKVARSSFRVDEARTLEVAEGGEWPEKCKRCGNSSYGIVRLWEQRRKGKATPESPVQ